MTIRLAFSPYDISIGLLSSSRAAESKEAGPANE